MPDLQVPGARTSRARFQLYVATDVPLWRLLGGNNRAYGRSVRPMLSVTEAQRSCLLAATAAVRGTFELSSASGRAWTWVLIFEGEPVARSDSPYGRRIECRASAARFKAAAPAAMLTIVRYVPRELASTSRVSLGNVGRSPLWDNGVHGPLGR
ncbi:hypothetical protein [Lapillicoccus sp.]|uniref:hypothetical protein n=1 Tax=Lapillicoccus sp. TaxID=1909287 RepID=UPI0025CFCBC3|nr:hypothetical protein [Lapillicoccus sp.]